MPPIVQGGDGVKDRRGSKRIMYEFETSGSIIAVRGDQNHGQIREGFSGQMRQVQSVHVAGDPDIGDYQIDPVAKFP